MKNYSNYRAIVFTVTTSLIFFIWSILQSSLNQLQGIETIYTLLVGSVVSLGAYKMVLKIAEKVILYLPFAPQIIFGNTYLDGVWVGVYIGRTGKPRYIIEYFEQDLEHLITRGKAFYEDKTYKGCWTSDNVAIDPEKGNIKYTYNTVIEDISFYKGGFAEFHFERKSKHAAPYMLFGFSTDSDSPFMNKAVEVKVDSKELTEDELIEKAIEVFNQNKGRLLKHEEKEEESQAGPEDSYEC